MTISIDYSNKLILSSGDITDIILFHQTLRDFEDNPDGILYPTIHTYKELDIGNGAKLPAIDFINGWVLKFPSPGNYVISGGNLNCQIVPVSGVYIKHIQSAAYAVSSTGGGGGSASEIADAVWQHNSASNIAIKLAEVWGRLGLDVSKPLVTGSTTITFGDIVMAMTESAGSVTVSRQ